VLRSAPTDADINIGLGSLLVETGKTTEAYPYLQMSRRSGKYDPQAFYAIAVALHKEGHLDDALAFIENALTAKLDFLLAIALEAISSSKRGIRKKPPPL
jgi:predicted Zn-dependent protease